MEFRSIDDIKQLIESIMHYLGSASAYYDKFEWFSKVRYTTTTEYFGELRIFLLEIMNKKEVMQFRSELRDMYRAVDKVLRSK